MVKALVLSYISTFLWIVLDHFWSQKSCPNGVVCNLILFMFVEIVLHYIIILFQIHFFRAVAPRSQSSGIRKVRIYTEAGLGTW